MNTVSLVAVITSVPFVDMVYMLPMVAVVIVAAVVVLISLVPHHFMCLSNRYYHYRKQRTVNLKQPLMV
jgi:hypothetical protein